MKKVGLFILVAFLAAFGYYIQNKEEVDEFIDKLSEEDSED